MQVKLLQWKNYRITVRSAVGSSAGLIRSKGGLMDAHGQGIAWMMISRKNGYMMETEDLQRVHFLMRKEKMMSHYKEFAMGLIDEDEFRSACYWEFAGEDDYPEEEEEDDSEGAD